MLSSNARKSLQTACPQNRGSAVAEAGSDGNEIANAIDANSAKVASDVAAVSTANAVDLPTAEALANQLKTTVNAMLAALKAAGLMS
jgi:hypothetical protein